MNLPLPSSLKFPSRQSSVLTVSGMVLLIGLLIAAFRLAHNKGPAIRILSPIAAFHENVMEGGVQRRTYPISFLNTGNSTLHVREVDTSCGCTTVKIPDPVPPAHMGHLNAEVVVPPGVIDNKTVQIAVKSDAVNTPIAVITLKLYVRQAVSVTGEEIDFGDLPESTTGKKGFSVSYVAGWGIDHSIAQGCQSVLWAPSETKIQLMKDADYRTFVGTLNVISVGAVGRHQETICFEHPNMHEAKRFVVCNWNVVPAVRTIPESIVLGKGVKNSSTCMIVTALPELSDPVLDYDPALLSVQVTGKPSILQHEMSISVREPRVPKRTETTIKIKFAGKGTSQLQVVILPDC